MKSLLFPLTLLILCCLCQCKRDLNPASRSGTNFSVKVRLPEEPARLNPMLSSTFIESQILNLLFLPLAEYDPYTLEYKPVLIKEIPAKLVVPPGEEFAGEAMYQFEIRENARWSDGNPVLASDYLFTAKVPFIPQVNATSWLGYLNNILAINLDEENPRKFEVIVEKEYLLSIESATNFQIYPKHVYDQQGLLDTYSFEDLRHAQTTGKNLSIDSMLINFSQAFMSDQYSRNVVIGSGPYVLDQWETGQYLAFNKSADWWGDEINEDTDIFTASPDRIIYQIIADESVAITSLKDGQIDVMTINDPIKFISLKEDLNYKNSFHFMTARIPVYYYIGMNNQSELLNDLKVRKAVAYTLDVDQIINDLMHGTAIRTVGPINPGKSYYNQQIKPIPQDLEKAKELLIAAGWEDSNDNGIVDKVIDGKVKELILRFFVTQQELGRKTALLHQEAARKVGIQIDLVTKPDFNIIMKEHLATGDFELVASGSRISPADYDPYQNWHSDNYEVGSNALGFANDQADEIIDQIRSEEDPTKRAVLYLEFQQIIHEQQPAIFLFSPAKLIIVNNRFNAKAAERRPGYFENHFNLKI